MIILGRMVSRFIQTKRYQFLQGKRGLDGSANHRNKSVLWIEAWTLVLCLVSEHGYQRQRRRQPPKLDQLGLMSTWRKDINKSIVNHIDLLFNDSLSLVQCTAPIRFFNCLGPSSYSRGTSGCPMTLIGWRSTFLRPSGQLQCSEEVRDPPGPALRRQLKDYRQQRLYREQSVLRLTVLKGQNFRLASVIHWMYKTFKV